MEDRKTSKGTSSSIEPRRILVRGVNWLGDAVMTMPALQRLRERFPRAQLTLLTTEKIADLWQNHSSIDEIMTFASGANAWSVASRVRSSQPYDVAVVLPNSPRSALEVWLAHIPRRVGYSRPWRNWLLTQTIATRPGHVETRKLSAREIQRLIRPAPSVTDHASWNTEHGRRNTFSSDSHQIYEYLHLVAALGANEAPVAPSLAVTTSELGTVAHRFGLPIVHQEKQLHPLFGLNPGAEYGPAKRWPSEQFISAAAEIQRRTNCRWLIFGGKGDVGLAEETARGIQRIQGEFTHQAAEFMPPTNLAGKTTLRELCALLKLCRVLLTNDTGPMHVAAAVGTPVVVPFGSTSPELTGPGLPGESRHRLLKSDAPCSPCFRRTCPIDFRCMTGIAVDRVVQAVLESGALNPKAE